MKIFFSNQELYTGGLIDMIISRVTKTFTEYLNSYSSVTQIVFLVFLAF